MAQRQGSGYLVILVTFLVAAVLTVIPLPTWLQWARPEWTTLTLIYWCMALPHRIGIATGLLAGLGVDILEGAVLGQNALALVVVALLSLLLYQRLRVYSLAQQAGVVFILVGIHQLICQWVQNIEGVSVVPPQFLLPAVTSALLWPVVLLVLRRLRRNFEIR
ncbi:MAG: rod shape-determining protein MreD [Halioglobus sp.]|nr:rod shape-determining protein MreD [Halioglobus sp.]